MPIVGVFPFRNLRPARLKPDDLKDSIEAVTGVLEVDVTGGLEREIRGGGLS